MILEDYRALHKYCAKIIAIGRTVNDADLFKNIQKACREKQAFLFSEKDSFVVLTFKNTSLFIWAAWSSIPRCMDLYTPMFEQMGRDIGATQIEFWSVRKGFFKRLSQDWSHQQSTWNETPITVWTKPL